MCVDLDQSTYSHCQAECQEFLNKVTDHSKVALILDIGTVSYRECLIFGLNIDLWYHNKDKYFNNKYILSMYWFWVTHNDQAISNRGWWLQS